MPVLLALLLAGPLQEVPAPNAFEIGKRVSALAFDPSRFFENDRNLVRITYRGDDYGWPVYAIAVRKGCGKDRTPGCAQQIHARMVRPVWAGGKADPERPRWRGLALVQSLRDRGLTTPEQMVPTLDTSLEWLEVELSRCEGALAALAQADRIQWVRSGTFSPGEDEPELVLHADTVRVEISDYLRNTVYEGYSAQGTPAAWAITFARTIEPCWRPSDAPRPWRRSPRP